MQTFYYGFYYLSLNNYSKQHVASTQNKSLYSLSNNSQLVGGGWYTSVSGFGRYFPTLLGVTLSMFFVQHLGLIWCYLWRTFSGGVASGFLEKVQHNILVITLVSGISGSFFWGEGIGLQRNRPLSKLFDSRGLYKRPSANFLGAIEKNCWIGWWFLLSPPLKFCSSPWRPSHSLDDVVTLVSDRLLRGFIKSSALFHERWNILLCVHQSK